jgi:hypothetical protein
MSFQNYLDYELLTLLQVKGLTTYFYGATPAYIPIAIEHARIDNGLSVPNLSGWFSKPLLITSWLITLPINQPNLFSTTYYVLCSQFDHCHAPKGVDSCELLIFRKGVLGEYLVNLRQIDRQHMTNVVNL